MIQLKDVFFSYTNVENGSGVSNINLKVKKGEVLLFTGASGSGKSTILRLINGLIPHFYEGKIKGEVLINGVNPAEASFHQLASVAGSVFQNPRTQFYNVDTTGELAFACENLGVSKEEILSRIKATVDKFQIRDLLNRNIFHLSGGQKQQIACGSVDVAGPDVCLLDEPTANLDFDAIARLRKIIEIWKSEGKTILIAEHRLSWIWDLCDRVIVLEKGNIKCELSLGEMERMTSKDLISMGLRMKEQINPSEMVNSLPKEIMTETDRKISIKNLKYSYGKDRSEIYFDEISFSQNKVTALVGKNGSGKTTLLHCLAGIIRKFKADIKIDGNKSSAKNLRNRVFLVMQDVNHQLFTESVLEEVLISMREEDEHRALEILEFLGLKEHAHRHPMSLSGGEKQRLAISCAVASERDILLFDEPTSGLDRHNMERTAQLMKQLKTMGKTILIVTHDSELIKECCDAAVRL